MVKRQREFVNETLSISFTINSFYDIEKGFIPYLQKIIAENPGYIRYYFSTYPDYRNDKMVAVVCGEREENDVEFNRRCRELDEKKEKREKNKKEKINAKRTLYEKLKKEFEDE